jgi:hypothetical protein
VTKNSLGKRGDYSRLVNNLKAGKLKALRPRWIGSLLRIVKREHPGAYTPLKDLQPLPIWGIVAGITDWIAEKGNG